MSGCSDSMSAQGGGLPPQGQVDHPRFPLIQYGAQEDGFSLGHGGEGNPVPAVQVFEGSVGEVEEGHGTVPLQGAADKGLDLLIGRALGAGGGEYEQAGGQGEAPGGGLGLVRDTCAAGRTADAENVTAGYPCDTKS